MKHLKATNATVSIAKNLVALDFSKFSGEYDFVIHSESCGHTKFNYDHFAFKLLRARSFSQLHLFKNYIWGYRSCHVGDWTCSNTQNIDSEDVNSNFVAIKVYKEGILRIFFSCVINYFLNIYKISKKYVCILTKWFLLRLWRTRNVSLNSKYGINLYCGTFRHLNDCLIFERIN